MLKVVLKLDGVNKRNFANKFKKEIIRRASKGISETAVAGESIAKSLSKKTYKTGKMYGSITNKANGLSALIYLNSNEKYPLWVHDGTKQHTFYAKNAPYLIFWWERENVLFKGKKVNHPGIQNPNPFMKVTAKRLENSVFNAIMRKNLGV